MSDHPSHPISAKLAAELKQPTMSLGYLSALDEAAQEQLHQLLVEKKRNYRETMNTNINGAADHLPRLLRGQFRKLFK